MVSGALTLNALRMLWPPRRGTLPRPSCCHQHEAAQQADYPLQHHQHEAAQRADHPLQLHDVQTLAPYYMAGLVKWGAFLPSNTEWALVAVMLRQAVWPWRRLVLH